MILTNKVVIVTGGGSGIGEATCLLCAEEGASVAIGDIATENASTTCEKILQKNGRAIYGYLDVSNADSVDAFVKQVLSEFKQVDVLVNNAGGRITASSVIDTSEYDWDKTFAINAKGVYLMSKAVLPSMVNNKSGAIINVSSAQGMLGRKNRAAYAATKGAIISLTRAMAADHGRSGIRVNCVVPGAIQTPPLLQDISSAPDPEAVRKAIVNEQLLTRIGEPMDVAQAIVFLASDRASWITAVMLPIDGGISAV